MTLVKRRVVNKELRPGDQIAIEGRLATVARAPHVDRSRAIIHLTDGRAIARHKNATTIAIRDARNDR